MQAVIDIGNSRIKAARFSGTELIEKSSWSRMRFDELEAFFYQEPWEHWICSSVADIPRVLASWIAEKPGILLSPSTPLPYELTYTSPDTLGNDRRALAAGAIREFPDRNVLVVDTGTCITYDLVTAAGEFVGGAISPGPELRFRAMHEQTARLPLVTRPEKAVWVGRNTKEALQAGGFSGCVAEFEGYVLRLTEQFDDLIVVLSGGYSVDFGEITKRKIFVRPDLVLHGLNEILLYNAIPEN